MLLAAADTNDPDHHQCRDLLASGGRPYVTSSLVVAEAGFLIDRQLGPMDEAGCYRSIANGDPAIEPFESTDWVRVCELIEQYADLPLGGTDASLVVLVERYKADRLATLDHRHFSVVRPQVTDSPTLVP